MVGIGQEEEGTPRITTEGPEDGSGVLDSVLVPLPLQKLGSSFLLIWVGIHLAHVLYVSIHSNHLSLAGATRVFRAHGIRCRILRAKICGHLRACLL